MSFPLSVKAQAKAAVRRAVRASGYEIAPRTTSFVALQRRLLTLSDLLVDVGANVGQYADLVRSLGYQRELISFEPQQAAYDVLDRRARGDVEWEVRRTALGSRQGAGTLRVSANSVSSSLLDVLDQHVAAAPTSITVTREDVRLSTLDAELAAAPGERLWLKLDVQGSELDVLEGGLQTLHRVEVVQSEVSLSALYHQQTDYLRLCDFLRTAGFHLWHVQPGFQDDRTGRLLQLDTLFVRDGVIPS